MNLRIISLVAIAMIPVTGRAEGESKLPTSLPPSLCSAKASIEEDQIQVSLTVAKMVPYMVTTMVPTTGPTLKTVFMPRASLHHKACTSSTRLVVDGTKVKVTRKDGKAVDPKVLPTLLRKGAKVLVFTEGAIDPYYLDLVSDKVLIFTIPADMKFPFRPRSDD